MDLSYFSISLHSLPYTLEISRRPQKSVLLIPRMSFWSFWSTKIVWKLPIWELLQADNWVWRELWTWLLVFCFFRKFQQLDEKRRNKWPYRVLLKKTRSNKAFMNSLSWGEFRIVVVHGSYTLCFNIIFQLQVPLVYYDIYSDIFILQL